MVASNGVQCPPCDFWSINITYCIQIRMQLDNYKYRSHATRFSYLFLLFYYYYYIFIKCNCVKIVKIWAIANVLIIFSHQLWFCLIECYLKLPRFSARNTTFYYWMAIALKIYIICNYKYNLINSLSLVYID